MLETVVLAPVDGRRAVPVMVLSMAREASDVLAACATRAGGRALGSAAVRTLADLRQAPDTMARLYDTPSTATACARTATAS